MRNSWCITTVVLTRCTLQVYMHLQEIVLLHE